MCVCHLELEHRFDLNCVALMLLSGDQKLGHLAREVNSPISGPSLPGRICQPRGKAFRIIHFL